jgi:hypothetical protein
MVMVKEPNFYHNPFLAVELLLIVHNPFYNLPSCIIYYNGEIVYWMWMSGLVAKILVSHTGDREFKSLLIHVNSLICIM